MLARVFLFFGGLLVLALCAALAVPLLIDWNSYRATFEREAEAILGRRVTVGGTATARLLPFPSVTFTDVSVAGGPQGEPAMTIATFSMDAELAPLMSGEFRIFDMRLVRPTLTLDLNEDGTLGWALQPSTPLDPRRITLEKLTVEDGAITLRQEAGGRVHRVTAIEADLSARSFAGPWRLEGTMLVEGMPTRLSASSGAFENGRALLRVNATPEPLGVALSSEGEIDLAGTKPRYAGSFRLNQMPPPQAGGDEPEAEAPPPGFRVIGEFALDPLLLDTPRFRLETGPLEAPYTADGRGSIAFGASPRFDVEATGAQVRLEDATDAAGKGARVGSLALADRLAAFEAWVTGLPQFGIPGSIRLDLPAIVAGDTTVRDVRLAAEPVAEGWRIASLAATLPGRATLEAEGLLSTRDALRFDGDLLLAVAQPSGFAAWLARDVDEAIRRLPSAGFSGKVSLGRESQRIDNLELVLDGASFRGRAESRNPPGGRPSASAELSGGALDLDQALAFASIFVSDAGQNRLARDIDLALRAGPVEADGVRVGLVDGAFKLRDAQLEIARLAVEDLSGANIQATGTMRLATLPPTGSLDLAVQGEDLADFARMAATRLPPTPVLDRLLARLPVDPGLLANADLALKLRSERKADGPQALALEAGGVAGGTVLDFRFTGTGDPLDRSTITGEAQLSLRNPEGERVLSTLGLPALPLGLLGEAQASATMQGSFAEGFSTQARLTGDGAEFGFQGRLSSGASGVAAIGALHADARDVEPWMQSMGLSVPGFGLGTPVSLRAEADYGNGLLVLSGIEGAVDEEAVAGDLNIATSGGVPDVSGALSLDGLDLERAAAIILGPDAFASNADGLPATPFAQNLAPPFTASLDLSVGSLALFSDQRLQAADFGLRLGSDRLVVEELTARFHEGTVRGGAEVRNGGGTALFSAQFAAEGIDLATLLPRSGLVGKANLSASLASTGKSVEGLVAGLSGSGTARAAPLVVEGLNPAALPALIARADEAGREVAADDVARFARGIAADGRFTAERAESAFSIVNGVLRVPPVTLRGEGASLVAEARAELAKGTVDVSGTLELDPGEDALVGSAPDIDFTRRGALGEGRIEFASAPLAQFLTQRALEREQARVEAMQAALLEKQRLRRETRLYAALAEERARLAAERDRAAEAVRLRAEERAGIEAEASERRRLTDASAQALEGSGERGTPPAREPAVPPLSIQDLLEPGL